MRIIVTHNAPDWDAVTSVWLIKRFVSGWEEAKVEFVPAGQRSPRSQNTEYLIEKIDGDEIIHVDTGLGPLDHHQTQDNEVCAASLTWEYVKKSQKLKVKSQNYEGEEKWESKEEALERIVKVVVEIDHFREVFWENPTADYHEFSLLGVLEGIKIQKPGDDLACLELGFVCLDALLHNFENRIWAEKEIREKGKEFTAFFGKGIAFETINDTVLKLAQKMGYILVVRKDPRKGYVRIKARPSATVNHEQRTKNDVDLTPVYEKLREMDPEATWYLHVSKKMLLNGTPKNPKMIPTKLSLDDIITVLKSI